MNVDKGLLVYDEVRLEWPRHNAEYPRFGHTSHT